MEMYKYKFSPGQVVVNKTDLLRIYKIKSIVITEKDKKYVLSTFSEKDEVKDAEYLDENYIVYAKFLSKNFPGEGWVIE